MKLATLGAALAVALVPASANATTFVTNTYGPTDATHFFLTNGSTPFSSTITAYFTDSFGSDVNFTDMFKFMIPTQSGLGGASVSTSFVSNKTKLIIDSVTFFNGVTTYSYTIDPASNGQQVNVTPVPIFAGLVNTLTVKGHTLKATQKGVFSGTATFEATTVPEPASWAMMIGGVAVLGVALRRRRNVAVSYA